jgi:ribosomal protein L13E
MVTIEPRVLGANKKQRSGKGFSREEMKKAGLTPREALKHGVIMDYKRKTGHDENVEALKALLAPEKPATKRRRKKS